MELTETDQFILNIFDLTIYIFLGSLVLLLDIFLIIKAKS